MPFNDLCDRAVLNQVPSLMFQVLQCVENAWQLQSIGGDCQAVLGIEAERLQTELGSRQLQQPFSSFLHFIHPADRANCQQTAETALAQDRSWHWEGRIILPSGQEKRIQCAMYPLACCHSEDRGENRGTVWSGLMMDITGRETIVQQLHRSNLHLTQQLERYRTQLKQKTQELQALHRLKENFLNATAHELRTSLMGLLMMLNQWLKQPGEMIPLSRSILERLLNGSDRQLARINALVDACGCNSGMLLQVEPMSMATLVAQFLTDCQPILFKQGATLIPVLEPNLPLVAGDAYQLRRVLQQLLAYGLRSQEVDICLRLTAQVESDRLHCTFTQVSPEVSEALLLRGEGVLQRDISFESNDCGAARLSLCRHIIAAHGGQFGTLGNSDGKLAIWFTLPFAEVMTEETVRERGA